MTSINDILHLFPVDCRPGRIEPLGMAGGMSGAKFWRIVAPRGTLVLRRWPDEHPTPNGLRFIHAVLQHASRRGIEFIPIPIARADGETFVRPDGHLWELTPWLAGKADFDKLPTPERMRAAMLALATFHNAVADFPKAGGLQVAGVAPAIISRLDRLHALQSGGVEELGRAVNDYAWPELAPLARQFLALLPAAVPNAVAQLAPLADVPFPLQPCIRDIWHDHVLFDGNRVTGFIDFGAMQLDTPATDVARLLGSLAAGDTVRWRDGLAAYAAVRPLAESESLAIAALDQCGPILAGCNWIRWVYVDRRVFNDPARIVTRFHDIVRRVTCTRQDRRCATDEPLIG